VLINNAGILRDKSYVKMTIAEMEAVMAVHLLGSVRLTQAVLPHMKKQRFGRLIFTTSAVGLYGNFGQVNYSGAKAAILGFARCLDKELHQLQGDARCDIKCNVIAPNAGTAMTATVLPPDIVALLKPELVAPLVVLLSSRACPSSGAVLEVGSGWQAAVRVRQSQWGRIDDGQDFSNVLSSLRTSDCNYPINASESLLTVLELINGEKLKANQVDENQREFLFSLLQKKM
jgi:multifunctional beta-oxidation protein